MDNKRVALCVDEEALRYSDFIGLEGEKLEAQSWLLILKSGSEARDVLAQNKTIGEFWVLSSGDISPINLAASVKADFPQRCVRLVTQDKCGSVLSRAHTAQIDEVLDMEGFVRLYFTQKHRLLTPTYQRRQNRDTSNQDQSKLVLAQTHTSVMPLTRTKAHIPVRQHRENSSFILSVVSGSGGVGKSSVSALSAAALQKAGLKTLLLDCDLQFGDMALMTGKENPLSLDEVIKNDLGFKSDFIQVQSLSVLAAPKHLEMAEKIGPAIPVLLSQLSSLFDVIVINTGAYWTEHHISLLEESTSALFLIDQRISSLNATRHALGLCARCGIAAQPFHFALNHCGKQAMLTSMDVSATLQGSPVYELKDGGRDVEDLLSTGAVFDLLDSSNAFGQSVVEMLKRLIPPAKTSLEKLSPQSRKRTRPFFSLREKLKRGGE